MSRNVEKTAQEWKQELGDEQFHVCREKGTERPFTGAYVDCKDSGIYRCSCCGHRLFHSDSKFDSGTGWPSFTAPVASESVDSETDASLAMQRTEVLCHNCGAHLGHVFDDGPAPTGQRFCINSVSLKLDKED
ncbi:MAG TPA: peptide-methionine (R)-S-oxide reductase MsrB [Chromatiaceae bacterium]|jgi:peptide-methionine (R)-S-oxide reductase|nr:peptide-methionine (R)-S-oxide reductase MsrB [Chromatiaceae bacterium]HIB85166.1 peptide-methionine (R)-S-oxide reductase MsrB [Chromatiaceae bacterium]HIN81683.1 peptide-methionine (R)-S-oxide reductase [Chromatiales bacterium]HIO13904.1 peptide-methionine (R)-S-oxide reductase [Chromatiales bacterium]HIO54648.1 peptide-methionine (R)-S-oxide reductase [Chromatiales bacterium]